MAEHRSASQLNTFNDCSEAYRVKYVDKPDKPLPPAAWLAQGVAYHEAVSIWEESGRSPLVNLETEYLRKYDELILQYKTEEPELKNWLKAPTKKTDIDIEERRARGVKQVWDYYDYANQTPFVIKSIDEYTLAVEVVFEIVLNGITIKGAIDQILMADGGVEVRDLKTGNRESASVQLGIYKIAVEKIFGWPVKKASFFYAKDSKVVTLTDRDLARYTEAYVTDLFSALDRAIKNEVFIPNPGGHCLLCPVKRYCREYA
jgi:putative RecB family exonuclease